jgi:peptidoglycan-N-acetylglucosamine deacetylase
MIARLMDITTPRLGAMLIPSVVWRMSSEAGPVCALTFDDGPTPGVTDRILDLLEDTRMPATFFVLATAASRHPDTIQRIVANGHDIALHGLDHRDPWKSSQSALVDSLHRAINVLADLTGQPPIAYRPPYGHLTPRLVHWAEKNDMPLVMWDFLAGDFRRNASPTSIAGRVHSYARPGSIIVLHDNEAAGHVAADSLPGVAAVLQQVTLRPITLSQALL